MALQKQHIYMGITLPEAYFKIDPEITLDYKSGENVMIISVYADANARQDELALQLIRKVVPQDELIEEESDDDYRDRFYRWLKTQDDFLTAEDV